MRLLHSLDGPTDNLPYILVWGVQVKASLPLFCCAHKAASSVDVLQHLRGVRLADGAVAAGFGIFSFASSIRSLTDVCWLHVLPLSRASRRLPLRWFSLCFPCPSPNWSFISWEDQSIRPHPQNCKLPLPLLPLGQSYFSVPLYLQLFSFQCFPYFPTLFLEVNIFVLLWDIDIETIVEKRNSDLLTK